MILILIYTLYRLRQYTNKPGIKHGNVIYFIFSVFYIVCIFLIMNIENLVNQNVPFYAISTFVHALVGSILTLLYAGTKQSKGAIVSFYNAFVFYIDRKERFLRRSISTGKLITQRSPGQDRLLEIQ